MAVEYSKPKPNNPLNSRECTSLLLRKARLRNSPRISYLNTEASSSTDSDTAKDSRGMQMELSMMENGLRARSMALENSKVLASLNTEACS